MLAPWLARSSAVSHLPINLPVNASAISSHDNWLYQAEHYGGSHWVTNAETEVTYTFIGGHCVPVTILLGHPSQSSYVASPHAAWISYPYAEAMHMITGWRQPFAKLLALSVAAPLSVMMSVSNLHRAAIVANHFLSTNLHPSWNAEHLRQATPRLINQFPNRPLVMRSICRAVDADLANGLEENGWRLVPARQIYVVDPRDDAVWRHNHVKRDRKLLSGTDLELVSPQQLRADELPQLRTLFRQLFLDKHSALNPDFTPEFFTYCHEHGFLDLFALRLDGRPVGVLGVLERNGWVTTPLIGYDLELPQALGVYRRLMAHLFMEAKRRACRLHLSSGAGTFKSARGGTPHLEYTAIYDRHLHPLQRHAIAGFSAWMDKAVPWALAKSGER
jgi:Acetyltransferase (GNAT) domain